MARVMNNPATISLGCSEYLLLAHKINMQKYNRSYIDFEVDFHINLAISPQRKYHSDVSCSLKDKTMVLNKTVVQ